MRLITLPIVGLGVLAIRSFAWLPFFAIEYKIRLRYKSGHRITAWFNKFDIRLDNGSISHLTWNQAVGVRKQLQFNVSQIESVEMIGMRLTWNVK